MLTYAEYAPLCVTATSLKIASLSKFSGGRDRVEDYNSIPAKTPYIYKNTAIRKGCGIFFVIISVIGVISVIPYPIIPIIPIIPIAPITPITPIPPLLPLQFVIKR